MTLAEEAKNLKKLKDLAAAAETAAKDTKATYQRAEMKFIERLEDEGLSTFPDARSGINFVPSSTQYAQIQDRSAFVEWAEAEQPELLEARERKALLNDLVREYEAMGQELPPGVGTYTREYVSMRVK